MTYPLTVVIPCYNEAFRISECFSLIKNNLQLGWEWIFVNDGSSDNTADLISEFSAVNPSSIRLLDLPCNVGKGGAVIEGIQHARGKIVGFVDADLAATPLEFGRLFQRPEVVSGKAMIIGIRVKTQGGKVKRFLYRHLMGRVFQTYVSVTTGLDIYDSQCGFKLLSTKKARDIVELMTTKGFTFDIEMILIALSLGMEIHEEMISWEEKGQSSIRLRHILQMIFEVWRIRSRHLHQPPKK